MYGLGAFEALASLSPPPSDPLTAARDLPPANPACMIWQPIFVDPAGFTVMQLFIALHYLADRGVSNVLLLDTARLPPPITDILRTKGFLSPIASVR